MYLLMLEWGRTVWLTEDMSKRRAFAAQDELDFHPHFDARGYSKLITPHLVHDREHARDNMRLVREISLTADEAITMYATHQVPSFDVSMALLEQCISTNDMVRGLSKRITIDETYGCWSLPLTAETDAHNIGRYPRVARKAIGAYGVYAYRFVVSELFDPELDPTIAWDHICRTHACCNPTHGELVSPATNNARKDLAFRDVPSGTIF
jgi:hypothetical protein